MIRPTRRSFTFGALAATGALAGCGNGIGGSGPETIEARVNSTLNFMYSEFPGTQTLSENAAGMLVLPLVTEAGLGFGASYGRGALRVQNSTVDYYSATRGSAGLQIGAQQYAHVLFFMTNDALFDFRTSTGWAAGADVEYAFSDQAESLKAETTTSLSPVIGVVFAQTGLRIGATVEGTKYTRIIP